MGADRLRRRKLSLDQAISIQLYTFPQVSLDPTVSRHQILSVKDHGVRKLMICKDGSH